MQKRLEIIHDQRSFRRLRPSGDKVSPLSIKVPGNIERDERRPFSLKTSLKIHDLK